MRVEIETDFDDAGTGFDWSIVTEVKIVRAGERVVNHNMNVCTLQTTVSEIDFESMTDCFQWSKDEKSVAILIFFIIVRFQMCSLRIKFLSIGEISFSKNDYI